MSNPPLSLYRQLFMSLAACRPPRSSCRLSALLLQADVSGKRLPDNGLTCARLRAAIADLLVKPLLRADRRYLGFRLMWNSKRMSNYDEIWSNITYYQQEVCGQLSQFAGIEFFLSTITATVTRMKASRVIHPGLAFWVAVDPAVASDLHVYTAMRKNAFSAELKLMTSKSAVTETDRQINNVAMAVKDFGPGYVQSKVSSGLGPGAEYLRDRLYLSMAPEHSHYQQVIVCAQQALGQVGLHLHVETY